MIRSNAPEKQTSEKPVAIVGADELTAFLFRRDWSSFNAYEFNLVHVNPQDGATKQLFEADDIKNVIKICHLVAFAVLDDGWIDGKTQSDLRNLVSQLEELIATWEPTHE